MTPISTRSDSHGTRKSCKNNRPDHSIDYRHLRSHDAAVFPPQRKPHLPQHCPAIHVAYFQCYQKSIPIWHLSGNTKFYCDHISPYCRCFQKKNQCMWQYHAEHIMNPRELTIIRNPQKSLETSVDHSVCVA